MYSGPTVFLALRVPRPADGVEPAGCFQRYRGGAASPVRSQAELGNGTRRTSIAPTRAQKSQAHTPVPIAKPHRPRHSKPRHSSPNAGHSHRKRQFWVAACLLLCGLFFWKSLPQDVNRPTSQPAADSVPTVLASAEPQPRYVTESIERLRIGDMVLAMDPATGEIGHHRVVDHFQRTAYELRVLEFIGSDAKRHRIETTDEHPFFVLSEGDFLPAAELEIGDQCPGPRGEIQTLAATRVEPRPEGVPVFNFGSDGAEATGTPSFSPSASGQPVFDSQEPSGPDQERPFSRPISRNRYLIGSRRGIDGAADVCYHCQT